jgi:predicted solute-binding protein
MRLGITPYVNARPLGRGLAQDPAVELVFASPARLADLLRAGALDAALVSSSEYFSGNYRLIPGQALSSSSAGADTVLYSNVECHLLRSVALDSASLSTNLLLRLALHWLNPGAAIEFAVRPQDALRSLAEFDACLLIGDSALEARGCTPHCLDLAELWFEQTGMPMVLSVWLAQKDAGEEVDLVVQRAAQLGLQEIEEIVQETADSMHWDREFAQRYLAEALDYGWTEHHVRSLELFGQLLAELGLLRVTSHGGSYTSSGAGSD